MSLSIYYATAMTKTEPKTSEMYNRMTSLLEHHGRIVNKEIYGAFTGKPLDETKINIPDRDFELLAESDITVADLRVPSTGLGMELMYSAAILGNPVLGFYDAKTGTSPMASQFQHPNMNLVKYETESELETKIDAFLSARKPSHKLYPKFGMCDAIDGAGKGQIFKAMKEWGAKNNLNTIDLLQYAEQKAYRNVDAHREKRSKSQETILFESDIPTWDELKNQGNVDLLLVSEPTYVEVGKVIRDEIIRKDAKRKYSAVSTAHAYALDRETLYNRLVTDALDAGIFVFSDRGVVTSQVYQPVQADLFEGISRGFFTGFIRGLPGNQVELRHTPGLLMLPQITADLAESRSSSREKEDKAVFERKDFQSEIAKVYSGNKIKNFYARRGTRVAELIMSELKTPQETREKTIEIWETYLKENNILS